MIVRATLVTDGSSDTVLIPILRWLCSTITTTRIELRWADLRPVPNAPKALSDRLAVAVRLYPAHVVFVHRDAEGQPAQRRYDEVVEANHTGIAHVAVVPVRMQEAWLLHDEGALREAAGRPSGTEPLDLPGAERWEELANPKETLHQALIAASGATGRRKKKFNPRQAAHRLADLIVDWSPLLRLAAFRRLQLDTRAAMAGLGAPLRARDGVDR